MQIKRVALLIVVILATFLPVGSGQEQLIFENMEIHDTIFDFYQVDHVVFVGNTLVNVTINVSEVANVTIIGNTFSDQEDVAILVWNSQNVRIENNTFTDQPTVPVAIHQTTGSRVISNTIKLSTQIYNPFYLLVGINIDRSPETLVQDNEVYSPLGDGIYINFSPHSRVEQNNVHDTGFIGLSFSSSEDSIALNNSITDSSSYRVYNTGNIPLSDAVDINTSPHLLFQGNIVQNSDNTGVGIISSDHAVITQNIIKGHKVSGIFVGLSTNVTIAENLFLDNGLNVETDQSPDLVLSDNTISSGSLLFSTSSNSLTPFLSILIAIMTVPVLRKSSNFFH